MATFFGEILPVVSRAVDDNDDEDFVLIEPRLEWVPNSGYASAKFFQANSLVLAVGSVATGFVESYCVRNKAFINLGSINQIANDNESTINKQKVVATIKSGKLHLVTSGLAITSRLRIQGLKVTVTSGLQKLLDRYTETAIFSVYLKATDDANVVFCTCNSYLAPDKLWSYKEKLFSLEFLSEIKEVVVLNSSSTHEYFHHDIQVSEIPFVKSICTTSYKRLNLLFPYLEQPNMIKGLSAAVLTTCEVKRIPAALYTCYSDTISLSISSINAFFPLLHHKAFIVEGDNIEPVKHMKALISLEGSEHALYT